jgi:hypothetical protein
LILPVEGSDNLPEYITDEITDSLRDRLTSENCSPFIMCTTEVDERRTQTVSCLTQYTVEDILELTFGYVTTKTNLSQEDQVQLWTIPNVGNIITGQWLCSLSF